MQASFCVYRMLLHSLEKSSKKLKKTCKKVLTLKTGCGIIYKSTRYGTETRAKVARHLKFVLSKLNNNLLKSECAGRAFYERETKSN